MLELSKDKPKHLISVLEKPFLTYVLDNVVKAGYTDIILVVGYKGEKIEAFIKNYALPLAVDVSIKCVSQYELLGPREAGMYGTACPLMCVKGITEPFVFLYGDNLYSVEDLRAMNIEDGFNYVAGMRHENPEKYGVLIHENGYLKEIIEKPGREFLQSRKLSRPGKEFVGDMINTGPFTFTAEVFEKLPLIKKSPRGEYEITDVISLLAKEGKVKVKEIDFWIDFGKPEDVEKLAEFVTHGGIK